MKSIGERIKLLKSMGISLADLASMLNVNKTTVWHWEKDEFWSDRNELAKGAFIKDLTYTKLREYVRNYESVYEEEFNVND